MHLSCLKSVFDRFPKLKYPGFLPTYLVGRENVELRNKMRAVNYLLDRFRHIAAMPPILMLIGCASYAPPPLKDNASDLQSFNRAKATVDIYQESQLKAVGYAVIDVQKGQTHPQRRLMAIRASKLDAYRNMAEQVYGVFLESTSQVSDLSMSGENIRGRVQGLIYGSRLVSIKPIGRDSYETTLSLDLSVVDELVERFRKTPPDRVGATPRENILDKFVLTDNSRPRWSFKRRRWETRPIEESE